jgi:hypothetical protein
MPARAARVACERGEMRIASLLSIGAAAALMCGACVTRSQPGTVTPNGPVFPAPGTGAPLPAPPGTPGAAPGPNARNAPPLGSIPPPRPGTSPTRWEYLCVDGMQLNAAGAQGWELATSTPFVGGGIAPVMGGHGGGGAITTTMLFCLRRALPAT